MRSPLTTDTLVRYAALRVRLTQPVTITDNMAAAFIAVYDYAAALQTALHQALNADEPAADGDELDADRVGRY